MAEADRRSSIRVPGKYEINFINEGDYLISYSKDISVDGMFIQTDSAPAVGELTQLTFSIGNVEKVSVNAKVVWVNDSESSGDPGMGGLTNRTPMPGSTMTGTAPALNRAKVSAKNSRLGRTIRMVLTPRPMPAATRPWAKQSDSRSSWRKVRWE